MMTGKWSMLTDIAFFGAMREMAERSAKSRCMPSSTLKVAWQKKCCPRKAAF
jgi:hypothetical protein